MNILNGDSAAGAFRQAFYLPREDILVFRDVLSCGRLTDYSHMDLWTEIRTGFWKGILKQHGFETSENVHDGPRDFYRHLEELKNHQTINLWLGCALSDQLLLVFVVKLFDLYGLDFSKLHLYQYLKFHKKNYTAVGLAVLSPEEIKNLQPHSLQLSESQIAFCLDVWAAVIADSPELLLDILAVEQPCLPLLHRALQNFLYRYPEKSTGLSHFDLVILSAAKKHAPNTARIIGHTLANDMWSAEDNIHELDTVGDIYLFSRLKNMAATHLSYPLLSLDVMNESLRTTRVEITEFGTAVLEGQYNVVEKNGIDDWIAGVHMHSSSGKIWFRDGSKLIQF